MEIELLDLTIHDLVAGYHDVGKAVEDNSQMLCRKCNREKSAK